MNGEDSWGGWYCYAPYVPGFGGGGPRPDPVKNYTSPYMRMLIAQEPEPPLPPPEPQVRIVYRTDPGPARKLAAIMDARRQARADKRRDAWLADRHRRGYCVRHNVHSCDDCNPHR